MTEPMRLDDEVIKFAAWVPLSIGVKVDELTAQRFAVFVQHIVNEQRKKLLAELQVTRPGA